MNPQQKQNLAVFLGGAAVVCFVIYKFMLSGMILRLESINAEAKTLAELAEKIESLQVKTGGIEAAVKEAIPALEKMLKVFPIEEKDTTDVSLVVNGVTADPQFEKVTILNAPPLSSRTFFYRSRSIPLVENVESVYKTLVMGGVVKPVDGGTVVPNIIKVTRLDQTWDVESDWESFPAFLAKLGTLKFFFEITTMDLYALASSYETPTSPKRVKASIVVSSLALAAMPARKE
jgi:hypothetical protein